MERLDQGDELVDWVENRVRSLMHTLPDSLNISSNWEVKQLHYMRTILSLSLSRNAKKTLSKSKEPNAFPGGCLKKYGLIRKSFAKIHRVDVYVALLYECPQIKFNHCQASIIKEPLLTGINNIAALSLVKLLLFFFLLLFSYFISRHK